MFPSTACMNEKAAVQNIVHKCQGRIHRKQSRCFEHRELITVVSQKEAVEIRPDWESAFSALTPSAVLDNAFSFPEYSQKLKRLVSIVLARMFSVTTLISV